LVIDGNMQSPTNWTVFWRSDAADVGTTAFNYLVDVPAAGTGGCLSIESFGQTGAHVYQAVDLTAGHSYAFRGAFKNSTLEDLQSTWVELILSRTEPPSGSDFQAGQGDYIYAMNVWMTPPYDTFKYAGFDGTFQNDFQFKWVGGGASGDSILTPSYQFTLPDTTSAVTWYVVVKAGCWATTAGDESVAFNLLFDEISLWDLAEPLPGTGIDELTNTNDLFDVSPNPSTGMVKIIYNEGNNLTYRIFNNAGSPVKTGGVNNSSPLDLSDLNKGIYYIQVLSDIGTETHKLILQ
jgi:hypothetical protein